MSARQKLNQAHLYGALLVAGVGAYLLGSLDVFWMLAALLTLGALWGGGIRLSGRK